MNRLLFFTQEMNRKSSTLGFVARWVEELSKKYDEVIVVCLYKGEYTLPSNVRVISLGKENFNKDFIEKNSKIKKIVTRIKYIFNFYRIIWKERKNYDKVFVHMNEEYVFLGGYIWKWMGKPVSYWGNHYMGNWMKDMAGYLCKNVFYTSEYSYTANKKKFPNGHQMPVGVDVDSLKTDEKFERPHNSILFLARFDPSKKPDVILRALKVLKDEGYNFSCDFVGGTSMDLYPTFPEDMKKLKEELGLGDNVRFVGAVPNTETYKYYLSHEIYLNVAKSGMLDKTIFKALAADLVTVTTSNDYNEMVREVVGDEFKVEQDSVDSLVERLRHVLKMDTEHKRHKVKLMQDVVIGKHSLSTLIQKISEMV
jgi:glycosyltransferase involved in cell wall biosynthesis